MKRTELKRGTSQLKRSGFKKKGKPLKKKSKQTVSKLQRDIWAKMKGTGRIDCYTCDAKDLQGANCQLGHLWAKASLGAYLKYDERVLRCCSLSLRLMV